MEFHPFSHSEAGGAAAHCHHSAGTLSTEELLGSLAHLPLQAINPPKCHRPLHLPGHNESSVEKPIKNLGAISPLLLTLRPCRGKRVTTGSLMPVDTGDRQKAGRAAISSSGIPSLTQRLNRMGTFTYAHIRTDTHVQRKRWAGGGMEPEAGKWGQ